MAATAQPTAAPHFKIVDRLDGVPAIHDSVAYAQALINSTHATASLYHIALGIATKSYELATPVISRTKPILESADGLAVATFDRAEATFPYPFKTPTQDLIVVKQAKGIYDARVAPLIQSANPVLHEVLAKTSQINSALGARAAATIQSSQEISHALVEQLKHLAAHGKEIPGHLLDGLQKTTNDVSQIVLSKDASLQEKSNKLGAYVVDQVKPVVDEIYEYFIGAKNKAQKEIEQAEGKTAQKAGQVVDQVQEATQ